jgi:hypothetical protein
MFYIELQFVYVPTGIILMQKRYAVVLLARFNMMECQQQIQWKKGFNYEMT